MSFSTPRTSSSSRGNLVTWKSSYRSWIWYKKTAKQLTALCSLPLSMTNQNHPADLYWLLLNGQEYPDVSSVTEWRSARHYIIFVLWSYIYVSCRNLSKSVFVATVCLMRLAIYCPCSDCVMVCDQLMHSVTFAGLSVIFKSMSMLRASCLRLGTLKIVITIIIWDISVALFTLHCH